MTKLFGKGTEYSLTEIPIRKKKYSTVSLVYKNDDLNQVTTLIVPICDIREISCNEHRLEVKWTDDSRYDMKYFDNLIFE